MTAEGLLLVDKPKGWTSHDVVAALRRRFPRGTKVGHCGTLDPMATGLLILLVGRATRRAAAYQKLPKVYSGKVLLGRETDTGDLEGTVTREAKVPALSSADLEAAFADLVGEVRMPVPKFSAVKHEGRPLYEYARRGVEVPEKVRDSRIYSFELHGWVPPEAAFRLACSSGTYVRALAQLLGRRLGCGAVLSALRREAVGGFSVDEAHGLESLRAAPLEALAARIRREAPVPA